MAALSDMLVYLRKRTGLSQQELAHQLGLTRSAVGMYETGKREPSLELLAAFAEFFHVDMNTLTGSALPPPESGAALPGRGVRIPVLGAVAAGVPIEAVEEILDYEEITPELAETGDYFALKIKGASMEPRMLDGDVVIVRQQEDVESGDVAVVLVEGNEATVKKLQKQPGGLSLIPFNPTYPVMFYSLEECARLPVQIIGKVVELRGKL